MNIRIWVMRTEYNTDVLDNPKEIATLYDVCEQGKDTSGVITRETVDYQIVVRRKSKQVLKQDLGHRDFFAAQQAYHRLIRERSHARNAISKAVEEMDRSIGWMYQEEYEG